MSSLLGGPEVSGTSLAVVGLAGRFPGAPTLDAFWHNLREGRESIAHFSAAELEAAGVDPALLRNPRYIRARGALDQIDQFDAAFFGMSAREAELLDPQQRLFLECAWQALEHAGYAPASAEPRSVAVYAGVGLNMYLLAALATQPELIERLGGFQAVLSSDKDYLATRVSYKLNLRGPSVTIQTACSSSLVAVHLACQSLLNGECDLALAGGVSISATETAGYLYQSDGILSSDGHCRAFDASASGTVEGDGVGIVVLKRLQEALDDGDTIHAIICGSAINNDGANKVGYTAPSVAGQAQVIAEALGVAGLSAETISYIEAHGTGTVLGDPIEVQALTEAFRATTQRTGFCAIGSVKSNIGHLDTAAGVAGLIKTILALKHGALPPSLHYQTPNPQIDFASSPFYVNTTLRPWDGPQPRRAGVSSFGIGGTNAHVIVQEAPLPAASAAPRSDVQVLPISARTAGALAAATADLAAYLDLHPEATLADVAFTLQVGRKAFGQRRALICSSAGQARDWLAQPDLGWSSSHDGPPPPVVFLFPGQGTQHPGMGAAVYEREPVFRDAVDRCARLLEPALAGSGVRDLRALLYPEPDASDSDLLRQTQFAQPALFVVEYALAKLWQSWGVRPWAMIGHSIGEYVAATLAGVLRLEDALTLVALRGRLMQSCPPGAMLSVTLPEAAVQARLGAFDQLTLAAVNGPRHCVVAGPTAAIRALERALVAESVPCQQLVTSHAFHSPLMAAAVAPFQQAVAQIELRAPKQRYLSNLTGDWITSEQAQDPAYWAEHLRAPVRFAANIARVLERPSVVLLEAGPGNMLSTLASAQLPPGATHTVVTSLRHPRRPDDDSLLIARAAARLWLSGVVIDWPKLAGPGRRRLPLPTYPFERQRYWLPAPAVRSGPSLPEPQAAIPGWRRTVARRWQPDERRWVVLAGQDEIGPALLQRLQQAGQRAVIVRPGARFMALDELSYTLNPRARGDYAALLAALAESGGAPLTVVDCRSLTAEDSAAQSLPLLLLAQTIAADPALAPARLLVVARQLHDISGTDPVVLFRAGLLAVSRVVPHTQVTLIDLGPAEPASPAALVEQILSEATARWEPTVAYRGAQRWVAHGEPVDLDRLADASPPRDGLYVIVGGLTPSTAYAARALALAAPIRLVVLSPERLPDRAVWAEPLSAASADPTSQVVQRIQLLEAAGAQVEWRTSNCAAAEVRSCYDDLARRSGAPQGLIYTLDSTALPDAAIEQVDADTFCEELRRGHDALLELEAALRDWPLGFRLIVIDRAAWQDGAQALAASAHAWLHSLFVQRQALEQSGWRGLLCDAGAAPSEGQAALIRHWLFTTSASQLVVEGTPADPGASVPQAGTAAPSAGSERQPELARHARPALSTPYVAPADALEQTMVSLWQELLGVEPVGVDDDFFALGGHSLLGIQLTARLHELFQVQLPLSRLFETPTPRGLSQALAAQLPSGAVSAARSSAERAPGGRIVHQAGDGVFPLSFVQEQLWFLEQLMPGDPAYNLPAAVRLRGALDVAALQHSLDTVMRRHSVLRATFTLDQDQPRQQIRPAELLELLVIDLEPLPTAERLDAARRLAGEEAQQPFDLQRGPLLRATLLRLAPDDHVALVTMHHIASDGWSRQVLIRELAACYLSLAAGAQPALPELPIQYTDFARWQREHVDDAALATQLAYWQQQLAGVPLLRLPTDRPRTAQLVGRGANAVVVLPSDVTIALRTLSRASDVTLFMTLLTIYQILLRSLSGQDDIAVGTPMTERRRAETEALIGFFVNTLVLRGRLGADPTFRQALEQTRAVTLNAYDHADLPFEKLVMALRPSRQKGYTPLFQVWFVLHHTDPMEIVELPGMQMERFEFDDGLVRSDLDLHLSILERRDQLVATFTYNTALFDAPTITAITERWSALVRAVVGTPDARLSRLMMSLQDAQREQMSMKDQHIKATNKMKFSKVRRQDTVVSGAGLIKTSLLAPELPLPLVIEPNVEQIDLIEWAASNQAWIAETLVQHGGLLLRGFHVDSVEEFERFARAAVPELLEYHERSTPRSEVSGKVYTSTEYPADQSIPQHNEHSYASDWPLKIWFCCLQAAQQGGATPITDSRKVLASIDPAVRERFREKQVMYVRNFGSGLDLPWQEVFQTADKAAVEDYCRSANIQFEWRAGDQLRTYQVRPAIVRHPQTGQELWFNQAHLFHVSSLKPEAREALLSLVPEAELPRNAYYGDGSPIEPEALDAIRRAYQETTISFPWQQGDILMLDNMLVAHGRDPFVGPRKIVVAMAERYALE